MSKDVIVIDLDGTLCDVKHREHLAQAKEWDEFHSLLEEDKPYADVLEFIHAVFGEGIEIWVLTGRNESYRQRTWDWLSKHEVFPDMVLMRPDNDYTPDGELKVRLLTEAFDGSLAQALSRVLCILDDRDSSIEGLRDAGFPVWQVRPSGY